MSADPLERHVQPDSDAAASPKIGVVVIGRNEGERLKRCLQSVRGRAACVVYVDSGSTDDSLASGRTLADAGRRAGYEQTLYGSSGAKRGPPKAVRAKRGTAVRFLRGRGL